MQHVYHLSNGQIVNVLETDEAAVDMFDPPGLPPGWQALTFPSPVAVDPEAQYVVGAALVNRPTSGASLDVSTITADSVDEATISGIPNPAMVHVSDLNGVHDYEVVDGVLVVTAAVAQTVVIVVSAFPDLDIVFEVTAT